MRVDQNFSAKDRLSGGISPDKIPFHAKRSLRADKSLRSMAAARIPATIRTTRTRHFRWRRTHLFSPSMINDLRFGFNNFALTQDSLLNGQSTANQYGVGNVNLADFPATDGFPYIYLERVTPPAVRATSRLHFLTATTNCSIP